MLIVLVSKYRVGLLASLYGMHDVMSHLVEAVGRSVVSSGMALGKACTKCWLELLCICDMSY